MKMLQDKVALVTGAGHVDGMGFAACRRLAAHGATVIVSDLMNNEDDRQALADRAKFIRDEGGSAQEMPLDVTRPDEVNGCVQSVAAKYGRIDILFNNAGTAVGVGPFLELGDEKWNSSLDVNLRGAIHCCRAVLPGMMERRSGAIINNASLAGLGVTANMAGYNASKFALVGLTKSLAADYGPYGIRVNATCPGYVWTAMGQGEVAHLRRDDETLEEAKARLVEQEVPLQRWASPDEIADAVVFLASPMSSYITGVALPITGGMSAGL